MPRENFPQTQDNNPEFEQMLTEVEQSLGELKQRYAQFQERQMLMQSAEGNALGGSLGSVKEKLEELEMYLKFLLFQWSDAREPFWQAIRFGGLGIVIGWLLKSWAG